MGAVQEVLIQHVSEEAASLPGHSDPRTLAEGGKEPDQGVVPHRLLMSPREGGKPQLMAISITHAPRPALPIRDAHPNPTHQRGQGKAEVEAEDVLEDAWRREPVKRLLLTGPHPNPARREAATPQPCLTADVVRGEAQHGAVQAVVLHQLPVACDLPLKMAVGPLACRLGRQGEGSLDVRSCHVLAQPHPSVVEGGGEAMGTSEARVKPGGQPSSTRGEGISTSKGEGEHRKEAPLPKEALSCLNHTCRKGGVAEGEASPEPTPMQARGEPDAADNEQVVEHARASSRLRRSTQLEVEKGGRLLRIPGGDVAEPVVEQRLEAVEHHRPQVGGVGLELIDD